MNDDIASLRHELRHLKELHASGALDTTRYEASRAPLERALVDAVTSGAGASARDGRELRRLLASLAAMVFVVACAGYGWTGAPEFVVGRSAPASGDTAAAQPHEATPEQIAAMVDKVVQRLKSRPDDAQGWTVLARAYAMLGRTAEAVPAYAKAVALRGDDAGLLADYADALAVENGRQFSGEPLGLIGRALQIDPGNPKALALAGTAAFDRKDYAGAALHWGKLAQGVPADSAYRAQVQAGIDKARQLGKLAPAGAPASASEFASASASVAASAASRAATALPEAGVDGRVTLAAKLAGQASPTDTVFVFARATVGSRMLLAVLRKHVRDLPFEFRLDDSMAMSEAAKLSGAGQVIVGARVSKSGDATPRSGDLTGQSQPVAPGVTGVMIEINEVLGK